jgi:hypothetical protein
MKELAFRTSVIVGRLRQLGSQYLLSDLADDLFHLASQRRRKVDLDPAPRAAVPYIAMWYLNFEHLFEAERLRAQLHICGRSMPDAGFVFDRTDRAALHFYRIGAAGQSQDL